MSLGDERRLEDLEEAVLRLRRAAEGAVLVVEGRSDVAALEALGIGGTKRTVNRGLPLQAWMDRFAEEFADGGFDVAILLLDWDRTGGRLFRRIWEGLKARVPVQVEHRRRIARASHARSLEDVPADLAALRSRTRNPRVHE